MKVLKIDLIQKNANYHVPQSLDNRMTYPLPQLSTVIGAIHNACDWKTYHPMNIGIIGNYDSKQIELKKINYLLDMLKIDRAQVIKTENNMFNNFYLQICCKSIGGFGANFLNGDKTLYKNKNEWDNYLNLKNDLSSIQSQLNIIKNNLKELKKEKKQYKKTDKEFVILKNKELEVIEEQKELKNKQLIIKELINNYKSLQSGVCHYEILNEINLILYISANDDDLKYIEKHLYNFTSIGRSEDFINIISSEIIDLKENITEIYKNQHGYNSYIDVDLIKNGEIAFENTSQNENINTTIYRIDKEYCIKNGKRVFNKKKVAYVADYEIEESCDNVFIDDTEKNRVFIVNLL